MEYKELMKSDLPRVLPVSKVIREGKDQKTIFVKHKENIKPGQFYMLWIPGIDSKPYAVAYYNKDELGFTSIVIGKFSNAFDKLKVNDKITLINFYTGEGVIHIGCYDFSDKITKERGFNDSINISIGSK